jgi:hypothetical protein
MLEGFMRMKLNLIGSIFLGHEAMLYGFVMA